MKIIKKWKKPLIIWVVIPLVIDFINLFLLDGRLPYLMLVTSFYLYVIIPSTIIWCVYSALVWIIQKKVVVKS